MSTHGLTLVNSQAFTRAEKLRIRSLYLVNGLNPRDIADRMGFDLRKVQQLIVRNKWPAKRRAAEDRAEQDALDQALGSAKEFVESVAISSVEMAAKGFEMAREAVGTKEFADAMRGTKIAVDLGRQSLGITSEPQTVNVLIGGLGIRPEVPAQKVEPEAIEEGDEVDLDFV